MSSIEDLVKEFGLTRQAFYYQRDNSPKLYKVYIDAFKYRELLRDMKKDEEQK